uniref:Uncharacterized protein n=1 Tax=Anguilla anguilla TaxID=7936 RepID=A0A0E9V6Q2_ANGAN
MAEKAHASAPVAQLLWTCYSSILY